MANNGPKLTPSNGISGGYEGNDKNVYRAMMSFTAIAWYNAIELLILIFIVFKKYKGLYFWSMLITSFIIVPYALGAWLKQVRITHIPFLPVSFSTISWMIMVTGNSIVLYSRLHLVTQSQKILRFVLWLIIVDSVLLYIPTAVLTYGSQTDDKSAFLPGYEVMEKIQMTFITVQEFLISGIYLWEVRKILRTVYEGSTRKLMWELASINIAIIILDVALLTVEFVNLYQIETTLKGMIYSIKLKLEFGVLSKLVKIVTNKNDPARFGSDAHTKAELGYGTDTHRQTDRSAKSGNLGAFSLGSWARARTSSAKKPLDGLDSQTSNSDDMTPEHLEFSTVPQHILESDKDTAEGTDVDLSTMTDAEAAEPPMPQRRRLSRSSIELMYPGKLDHDV